jgi:hypothetical protein
MPAPTIDVLTSGSVTVQSVFSADPYNVSKFLGQPGVCFYIPAYQRDFDWSSENVKRLLQDICHGWDQLCKDPLAVTFIGTIIAVTDPRADWEPAVRSDLPARIDVIVDGQQRLTSLLLLVMALHEAGLSLIAKRSAPKNAGELWLSKQIRRMLDELQKMFEEKFGTDADANPYYPRLIRRPEDVWALTTTDVRYKSPIARVLSLYGHHVRGKGAERFVPAAPGPGCETNELHRRLLATFQDVRRLIRGIARGKLPDFDIPSLEQIATSPIVQRCLLDVALPPEVLERLTKSIVKESTGGSDWFGQALRIALFSRYMQLRVAVTHVNAKNEDYAFDIFESLNTAGEPLTAYQTFKPRVVAMIPPAQYASHELKFQLDAVERYLQPFDKPEQRQKKTAELMTLFALTEAGTKLALRLSTQRRWIQRRFQKIAETAGEQKAFVKNLGDLALFMRTVWPAEVRSRSELDLGDPNLNEQAQLCLGVLRQANHTIVIPALVRFFQAWRSSPPDKAKDAAAAFVGALKATVAFWVLWRLSRRATDRIDDHYRRLMLEGKFARLPESAASSTGASLEALRSYLCALLTANSIASRKQWTDLVVRIPAYGNEYAATRLALLAASHDTVPSASAHGLLVKGRPKCNSRLNFDAWSDELNLSVEHVAPQTKEQRSDWDWPDEMYDDPDAIDLLGNLILFPQSMNSHLGNRSWAYKQAVYRILSAKTKEGAELAAEAAEATGITFDAATKIELDIHAHLQQTEALAGIAEVWSIDLVRRRTRNIAELAWDELAPWVGTVKEGAVTADGLADRPATESVTIVDVVAASASDEDAGLLDLDEEETK